VVGVSAHFPFHFVEIILRQGLELEYVLLSVDGDLRHVSA
jgi:hypothetical protein